MAYIFTAYLTKHVGPPLGLNKLLKKKNNGAAITYSSTYSKRNESCAVDESRWLSLPMLVVEEVKKTASCVGE